MKIIFGLKKIKKYKKPVVTLGVFDGVHRGHIDILKATLRQARKIKGASVVLTFRPHPQERQSLYSLEHRLRLIAALGIDICIVINFNQSFARIPPEGFVKDILCKKIRADYVFVGRNFRFGKDARGDYKTLKRLSKIYNFKLKLFRVVKTKNKPVSSTSIRNAIKKGDILTAQKLLSRPVSVLGTVIKGSSVARSLGFSTANIDPHHEVIPPSGVYAVRVIFRQRQLFGVCNIGTRPTFKTQAKRHIEVHIFNFQQNIYGEYLEVQFIKKLRDEKKFVSAATLAQQIKKDITRAKSLFFPH